MPDKDAATSWASQGVGADQDRLVALLLDLLAGRVTVTESAARAGLTKQAVHQAYDVFTAGGSLQLQGRTEGRTKSVAALERQAAELRRLLCEARSAVEMLKALERHLDGRSAES